MRVRVAHPHYKEVELSGGSLQLVSQDGREQTLHDQVDDFVVSISGKILHIVAFCLGNSVWHYYGEEKLQQDKVEIEYEYGRASRLITDGEGTVHLFYLTKESQGQGFVLRHQAFQNEWSNPMVVSTRVFGDSTDLSACAGADGYIHLVYLSHGDGYLLYRVYDQKQRIWSGAVPFSRKRCRHPLFINAPAIGLTWFEEDEHSVVRFMLKREQWSKSRVLSNPDGHSSHLGYATSGEDVQVLWMQGNQMWMADVLSDSPVPVVVSRDDYDHSWTVVTDESGASLTVPLYQDVEQKPPETVQATEESTRGESSEKEVDRQETKDVNKQAEKVELAAKDEAENAGDEADKAAKEKAEREEADRRKAAEEEARLQKAFIEQAFRIQYEWEELKSEYANVRPEITALQEQIRTLRREVKDWNSNLRIPDVDPINQKLERLERRLLKYSREQEQLGKQLTDKIKALEQSSLSMGRRLHRLEQPEDERQPGLLARILRRK